MYYKANFIKKQFIMYFIKKSKPFFQPFRNLSLSKFLFIFLCSLLLLYILFMYKKDQLCDPADNLYWFCSWPDPKTTVCTYDHHFPSIKHQTRSAESYAESFSSLPKVQPYFQYNNLTLTKCQEKKIDLLIFVISKCSHSSIRQSIRRTWANNKLLKEYFTNFEMKVLFLVDIDSNSQNKIQLEYNFYKDIVQVNNLPEQYEFVTQREASLYQFVKFHCQQTQFIFKTDDDIFLNTFLLLSYKPKFDLMKKETKYFLCGFPMEHGLAFRRADYNAGQRYIITKDEYSCPRYPTFLSGFGYLMSYQTASLFFDAYLTDIKPFPLSDVYFTGLLSEMMNIERQSISANADYRYESKCTEEFFTSGKEAFACAASDNHFNSKASGGDRSLMNDYNSYWMKLGEKYENLLKT